MKYVGKNGLKVGDNEVWHEGNLEIGGRNLLLDSKELKNTGGLAPGISRRINEEGHLEITAAPGNGNYASDLGIVINPEHGLQNGDVITVSVKVKSEDATGIPTLYLANSMGYLRFNGEIGSEFSTIQYTRIWNESQWRPHMGFSGISGTFVFKEIKLEKGTIPTDWTPAPEDIQEQIDKKWEYNENTIKAVKVNNAVNADTVNGKTVAVNVPSDAKFTDTVTTINGKTGTITKADITALGIPAQDTVYTHPTTAGNKHIPAGGVSGQFLKWSANGTATWDSVPGGLALGETSGTAYRGDRGKVAYDHSQNAAVHIKTVTSATEPSNLNAGDQWHKEY